MSQWTLFAWAKKCDSLGERGRRPRRSAASGDRQEGRGRARAKAKREADLVPVRLLVHDEAPAAERPGAVDAGLVEIQLVGGEVIRLLGDVSMERVRSVVAAVRQAC